jgi:serine/threonine protein kinase
MASLPAPAGDLPSDKPKATIINIGGHSRIEKVSHTVVAKISTSLEDRGSAIELLYIESIIYQRLGPHPCITRFLAFNDGRIYLELLQCSLQERLCQMNRSENNPTAVQLLRWSSQISRAFEHIHSQRVFQVDISLRNMLLDWDDNVKLSGFGGSSIDGSGPLVLPAVSYEHPLYRASTPTIDSELFAIGSAFYEMETLHSPYYDLDAYEIGNLYLQTIFPNTESLILGESIRKCWTVVYENASQVLEDIHKLQKQYGFVDRGSEN